MTYPYQADSPHGFSASYGYTTTTGDSEAVTVAFEYAVPAFKYVWHVPLPGGGMTSWKRGIWATKKSSDRGTWG